MINSTLVINEAETIGQAIKNYRKQYKITQGELAQGAGVSLISIIRYEKNNYLQASMETVVKILQFIGKYRVNAITLSVTPLHENMQNDSDSNNNIA